VPFEEQSVHLHFLNGKVIAGVLTTVFQPTDVELIVHQGEQLATYAMQQLAYVVFFGAEGEQPYADFISYREETIVCVDGACFNVHTPPLRYIRQGFFAVPAEPDGEVQRMFFFAQGVTDRSERPVQNQVATDAHTPLQSTFSEEQQLATAELFVSSSQQRSYKESKAFLRIGEILCSAGLITPDALEDALDIQRKNSHKHLGRILIEHGFVSEEQLLIALALKFQMRFVRLNDVHVDPSVLGLISCELAQKLMVFPIEWNEHGALVVATAEPTNVDVADTLCFHLGKRVDLVIATSHDIQKKIAQCYAGEEEELEVLIEPGLKPDEQVVESIHLLESEASQTPIVRLANKILLHAIERRASDIHLFPDNGVLKVLCRVDGVYRVVLQLDMAIQKRLVTRFKIISNMDITEHRLPQDGSIRLSAFNRRIEMRVSCMPSMTGENLVFRLFDVNRRPRTLDELGFCKTDSDKLHQMIHAPFGLVLVTGTTGSGKSSTLTSLLHALKGGSKHLISLEDPVETHLPGVEQIPINDAIGFTFARALRYILRHDPDVIMVGEIRDEDTAKIAVQAALTGHLLLSSLHTNTASAAFMRLIDLGVKPYLVASTVKAVLAQQLLPQLCDSCKVSYPLTDEECLFLKRQNIGEMLSHGYRANGCESCENSGIQGRKLISELLLVTPEISQMVINQENEQAVLAVAQRNGMKSLQQHAIDAAREGVISIASLCLLFCD